MTWLTEFEYEVLGSLGGFWPWCACQLQAGLCESKILGRLWNLKLHSGLADSSTNINKQSATTQLCSCKFLSRILAEKLRLPACGGGERGREGRGGGGVLLCASLALQISRAPTCEAAGPDQHDSIPCQNALQNWQY